MQEKTGEVTREEKLIAFLCHLSIFLGGLILPFIMWIVYRGKSKFIAFHSLQVLFFHIIYIVCAAGAVIIMGLAGFLIFKPGEYNGAPPFQFIAVVFLFYGIIILSVFVMYVYSVIAAVKANRGENFKYILIGKIIYKKIYD